MSTLDRRTALHVQAASLLTFLLFTLSWVQSAHADVPTGLTTRLLGIAPDEPPAAITASPPSAERRWGTSVLAWCERDRGPGIVVYVGEWSLYEDRWLGRQVLRTSRTEATCPRVIHLAWWRQELVIVLGRAGEQTEVLVLAREGTRFRELRAVVFDDAVAPSLAVDDRFLAIATFERNTPVLEASPSARTEPPCHALHVRLLEPSTLRIISARVFRGDHLLRLHPVPSAGGHALQLLAGRLYVAVPDDDPRVVALRVPSLTCEGQRSFVVPQSLRTAFSSNVPLGSSGAELTVAVDRLYVMSPRLAILARRPLPPLPADEEPSLSAIDGAPSWPIRIGR